MAKFSIQTHGRLQEWVAEEKGYFAAEGLDHELLLHTEQKLVPDAKPDANGQLLSGAFESYAVAKGRKGEGAGDISCACHWTVNQAAAEAHGKVWGKAYCVADAAIMVPPESPFRRPEDLAGKEVAVGYHSGSHYSAIQALEVFLKPEKINLRFLGRPWVRVDAALARTVPAANVWGIQRYVLEQQGFRKLVDTSFMIAFMFPDGVDEANIARYMRALRRAQMDIDLAPERYKHYYLKEIPERFHQMIDVRGFGPGERVVFEDYTREMFDKTQAWMHDRKLFGGEAGKGAAYEAAVRV